MPARSLLAPRTPLAVPHWPLLEQGFRPFFLLGAAFAALAVPLWLLALHGGLQPGGVFFAMQWHAHEMLFGFSGAIIAGFLLTAVSNWSGKETLTGSPLAALALLWTLGRLAMFFASRLPRFIPALLDGAFLPVLAISCALPLIAARSVRNYGVIGLLLGLSAANAVAHWAALSGDLSTLQTAHRAALDLIVILLVLMTGRVVPMFTRNATRLDWVRSIRPLEQSALLAVLLLSIADVWQAASFLVTPLAALAALLLLARMRFCASVHTRSDPLLWILHVGTLFLPLGMLLRVGAAITPSIPSGSSLHALTAGAIGTLTLGMMARVSLGHTGRMLKVPRAMHSSFLCLIFAALVRVVAPLLPSAHYLTLLTIAAAAWSSAFALFLIRYSAILLTPRADSR